MATRDGCSALHRQNYWKWSPCFWKRRKFAKNGIPYFAFKLSQSSEIVLQSRRKTDFSERGLALGTMG